MPRGGRRQDRGLGLRWQVRARWHWQQSPSGGCQRHRHSICAIAWAWGVAILKSTRSKDPQTVNIGCDHPAWRPASELWGSPGPLPRGQDVSRAASSASRRSSPGCRRKHSPIPALSPATTRRAPRWRRRRRESRSLRPVLPALPSGRNRHPAYRRGWPVYR